MKKNESIKVKPNEPTTLNCTKPMIFRIETISGSVIKGTIFPDYPIDFISKSDIKKIDLIYIDESKLN